MAELFSFLLVIATGLFFAQFFKSFHLPYVVTLIIGGILIGPFGLGLFVPDDTIEFIGEIGLVFLMFMAGLEIRSSAIANIQKGVGLLAMFNSLIPFIVGVAISLFLGYNWMTSLFLGAIFISSSIAVIVPSLENNGLLKTRLGKSILGATIVEDVLSLIIFSILLQTINPTHNIPLPFFYLAMIIFLLFLRAFIYEFRKFYKQLLVEKKDLFENELRFIFAILLATVILFDLLGFHPIIAGFFAGMVLSESIKKETMKTKLHTISYGLFIPVFFVIIGSKTDLSVFSNGFGILFIVALIVIGSILSKFVSGYIAGKLSGFNSIESSIMGVSTVPQLSTTLAVAFTGLELGILKEDVIIAMTILSISTTIVGPFLVGYFVRKLNVPDQPNVNA
ncbi:cation:proton antiporter [Candidatus Micrarchaeota archaeon]|nr:cation:proton antiporter [Candidatus Micrarchaeota archaeon]MBU1166090.1 cation:proton antiporter [Candidatus Micrarchaeota archaeon]MBU1886662.1 cation:proton antiporter [Candidatus Micrarchaeota archaeon]